MERCETPGRDEHVRRSEREWEEWLERGKFSKETFKSSCLNNVQTLQTGVKIIIGFIVACCIGNSS